MKTILAVVIALLAGVGPTGKHDRGRDRYRAIIAYIDTSSALADFLALNVRERSIDSAVLPDIYDTIVPEVNSTGFRDEKFKARYGFGLSDTCIPKIIRIQAMWDFDCRDQAPAHSTKPDVIVIFPQRRATSSSRFVLYMSPVEDGIIMAEILPIAGKPDFTDYNRVGSFNMSLKFLFKFDEKDSVTEVRSTKIFYD